MYMKSHAHPSSSLNTKIKPHSQRSRMPSWSSNSSYSSSGPPAAPAAAAMLNQVPLDPHGPGQLVHTNTKGRRGFVSYQLLSQGPRTCGSAQTSIDRSTMARRSLPSVACPLGHDATLGRASVTPASQSAIAAMPPSCCIVHVGHPSGTRPSMDKHGRVPMDQAACRQRPSSREGYRFMSALAPPFFPPKDTPCEPLILHS